MRTLTKFTSPFAPLHLAVEDEAQLEQVSNFFVQKAVAEYDKFLLRDQQVVDADEWRMVKRKENVRVYAQRCEKDVSRRRTRALRRHQSANMVAKRLSMLSGACSIFGGRSAGSTCGVGSRSSCTTETGAASLSSHDNSPSAATDGASPVSVELPVLLAAGSIPGTLEDAMYGTVAPTVEAMRVRALYTGGHVVDGAVLATVLSPSANEPFRTLSIKWIQEDYPMHVRSVIKHRDLVCLESTGTTTIGSGETVGFHLLHSVHFPQTHGIAGVVRGNISLCTIFRQQRRRQRDGVQGPSYVDVFTKCCLNPSDGLMRAVLINAVAQEMSAVDAAVHCARMKKLAWIALRRHTGATLSSLLGTKGPGASPHRASVEDSCCVTCKKRTSPGLRFLGLGERARCKVCCRLVCSACKMKKRLCLVPCQVAQLRQQDVTLCNVCVHSGMVRASALEVARDEVAVLEQQRADCAEAPPVRMGRGRSRRRSRRPPARREPGGEPSSSSRCSSGRALADRRAPCAISSSVAMDLTREFYGEPQADRW